jgi:hypothetical protein
VAERYRYARTPDARFLSFSMAKSVTSLLVGIALDKGLIASLDDPASRYVKDLEGSAYGATTVRQLLRMSSGIHFTERYDGNDDVAKLSRAITGASGPRPLALLRTFNERAAPAGEKFAYATAETEVLGRVLTGATGKHDGRTHQRMALETDGGRARRLLARGRRRAGAGRWRLQRHAARLGSPGPAAGPGRARGRPQPSCHASTCLRPRTPRASPQPLPAPRHPLLRLRLPVLAVPPEDPHLRAAGHPRPDDLRAARQRHRHGADRRL